MVREATSSSTTSSDLSTQPHRASPLGRPHDRIPRGYDFRSGFVAEIWEWKKQEEVGLRERAAVAASLSRCKRQFQRAQQDLVKYPRGNYSAQAPAAIVVLNEEVMQKRKMRYIAPTLTYSRLRYHIGRLEDHEKPISGTTTFPRRIGVLYAERLE